QHRVLARDQQSFVEFVDERADQRLDVLEVQDEPERVESALDLGVDLVVVPVQPLRSPVRKDEEVRRTELQVVLLDIDRPAFGSHRAPTLPASALSGRVKCWCLALSFHFRSPLVPSPTPWTWTRSRSA